MSEASSESVQWPKFWYIYIYVYLFIYFHIYIGIYILAYIFCGGTNLIQNHLCRTCLSSPNAVLFLVIRYISYIHL